MLSGLLAIAIGIGIWNLFSYFKKRGLQKKFSDGVRFEINDSLYGYVTDRHFVLIASAVQEEILRFGRDKLQRIRLSSGVEKKERKSDEIVVLEWQQENGLPKEFKLDIYDPNSKQKAEQLRAFIEKNALQISR